MQFDPKNNDQIDWSKRLLLALANYPPPDKPMVLRDTQNRHLRIRKGTGGLVSISVVKYHRVEQKPITVKLDISVTEATLPPMAQIRAAADKLAAEIAQGRNPNKEKKNALEGAREAHSVTLNVVWQQYQQDKPDMAHNTLLQYGRSVERYLSNIADLPMVDIVNAETIKHMYDQIITEARKRGLRGISQANAVIATWRILTKYATASDMLNQPLDWPTSRLKYRGVPMSEISNEQPRLKKEDYAGFFTVLDGLDELKRDAYQFLLFTGCRWSELEKLGKGDIDWARGALVFRQTKNKSDHTLPLTPTLLEIVKRRVAGTTGERLFPKVKGPYLTRVVQADMKMRITPHALRRSFASVAGSDCHYHVVSALLNHTIQKTDVTQKYIGDIELDDLKHALEKVESRMRRYVSLPSNNVISLRA